MCPRYLPIIITHDSSEKPTLNRNRNKQYVSSRVFYGCKFTRPFLLILSDTRDLLNTLFDTYSPWVLSRLILPSSVFQPTLSHTMSPPLHLYLTEFGAPYLPSPHPHAPTLHFALLCPNFLHSLFDRSFAPSLYTICAFFLPLVCSPSLYDLVL